jgi:outer membrane lipoprotein-sorting protein
MIGESEMVLIDKKGNQRVRTTKMFQKEIGEHTHSIRFFLHPADVKGTGFLTYDYDDADKDNDQWMFMPALGKVKRLTSSDMSGSFMGSDLNMSDLVPDDLEDYDFTLLKEAEVEGHKVWMIECIPRSQDVIDESGYSKTVRFIRQDNYFPVRSVRWVQDSQQVKYFDVKKLEQIDGIWVAAEMHVFTKKGKALEHKTIIRRKNTQFNQDLDDNLFTVRQLEKGIS